MLLANNFLPGTTTTTSTTITAGGIQRLNTIPCKHNKAELRGTTKPVACVKSMVGLSYEFIGEEATTVLADKSTAACSAPITAKKHKQTMQCKHRHRWRASS